MELNTDYLRKRILTEQRSLKYRLQWPDDYQKSGDHPAIFFCPKTIYRF